MRYLSTTARQTPPSLSASEGPLAAGSSDRPLAGARARTIVQTRPSLSVREGPFVVGSCEGPLAGARARTIARETRKGVVLLVVMAMLSLFSAVAIGYVFYSDSEATAAQLFREASTKDIPEIDPEVLAAYFLNQLIYPTDNIYSSMRGWDLSRSIFGYNPATLNYTPYNGVGRSALSYNDPTLGVNNFNQINYQVFSDPSRPADPTLNYLRTPEFYGRSTDANYRYVGGANPPWTAYDTNNMFLAEVLADGTVLLPSFRRPWLDQYSASLPAAQRVLVNRYLTLGPDPLGKMLSGQPWNPGFAAGLPDSDAGGDVKNLDFGPGTLVGGVLYNNDSIWMDLGFAPMTAANGKRYKPLFAPLVMDLSNRLHLWAHGNRIGAGGAHVSNQGHAASEVNASVVLSNAAERTSFDSLRYGAVGVPAGSPTTFRNTANYPWAAKIDADALNSTTSSSQPFTGFITTSTIGVTAGNAVMAVNYNMASGGFPWAFLPGMNVTIDTGAQAEVVTVLAAPVPTQTTFAANFTKAHPAGTTVMFTPAFPFRYFPPGWDNAVVGGANNEITQRPPGINLYNLSGLQAQGPLPLSNQEALLRFGGTNAPGVTSEIFRRMPNTLAVAKNRGMLTMLNHHLDRIAASPLTPWDTANGATPGPYQYVQSGISGYPKWVNAPPTPIYGTASTYPARSEFTADWRSSLGTALRVNVNREMTDYPDQNVLGIIDVSNATVRNQYDQALVDRQTLARDVYKALIRITGAQDPNTTTPALNANSVEYAAARWLAQFAVNIVDYVDNDDYITPFQWDATGNGEWVFGTELPRLVINEAYAQRDNDGVGNGKGKGKGNGLLSQDVNVWVEFYNPFQTTPAGSNYPRDGGKANLLVNGNAAYQLVLCPSNAALSTFMRNPANNTGDLDNASAMLANTVMDWGNAVLTQQVLPANGALSGPSGQNQGYYVLGPPANYDPSRDPNLPTTHQSAWMSLNLDNDIDASRVTILLRRLANPHLPPQANPNQVLYNPYITVDYLENIPAGDRRLRDNNGNNQNSQTAAFGRKHPYSAYFDAIAARSQVVAQTGGAGNQPNNSFYQINTPNEAPFCWLTHLDRPVVNQLELVHVSGFKPHELTQQFIFPVGNTPTKFKHYAPWSDPSTGLYRVLDLLGTPNNMLGSVRGGRWHGNVNINTMTELDILLALADAQDGAQTYTQFTKADVNVVFSKLITARNPVPTASSVLQPNSEGTPFQSFAARNLNDTWFRVDSSNVPVFYPPSLPSNAHRYAQTALLQKVFNNITTTSNVFAVWWTVGFFEVLDENVRPVRLGAEIGRAENRHVRHRFFAIVDRSGLQLFNTTSTNTTPPNATWANGTNYPVNSVVNFNGNIYRCIQANAGNAPPNPAFWVQITQVATMSHAGVAGTAGAVPISVQPGMLLEVDTGLNMEVVAVLSVPTPTTFTAEFTKSHGANVPIICRGNPGPRTNYNPRRDSSVVLHMSVIQ